MEYTKKQLSEIQEKEVAKFLGGRVTIGSGGTIFGGGDVELPNWLIECKTTTTAKNSYSVKKSVIDKIKEQSFEQKKQNYALAFRFEPFGEDYFVIDKNLFKSLVEMIGDVE